MSTIIMNMNVSVTSITTAVTSITTTITMRRKRKATAVS